MILSFVLSSACFHDAKVKVPILIGNAGYVGQALEERYTEKGTVLIATLQKN